VSVDLSSNPGEPKVAYLRLDPFSFITSSFALGLELFPVDGVSSKNRER